MGEDRCADPAACGAWRAIAGDRNPDAGPNKRAAAALLKVNALKVNVLPANKLVFPGLSWCIRNALVDHIVSLSEHDQAIPRSSVRPQASGTADLDDAAGRSLSAGIPGVAGESGRFSRSVLHAGIRRRSDPSADPSLRLRRRDHLLRYSRHSLCARPLRAV